MSLLSHRAWIAVAFVLGACGDKTPAPPAGDAALTIRITDGGTPVAARVGLFDGDRLIELGKRELYGGARQAEGACELARGAIGTANGILIPYGEATIPIAGRGACALPRGRHQVIAWRGLEHEPWRGEVTIEPGRAARLDIALERAWTPPPSLVADLHVHGARSNDSSVPQAWRVMGQACAGVQVTALSNHASNDDLDGAIGQLGLDGVIASIASNEGSSEIAHVGVYPVAIDRGAPRGGSPDEPTMSRWSREQILTWARAQPGAIVQVNHPRFRMYALFDNAHWNGTAWPPPFPVDFDAVEVLNGHNAFNAPGDRRIDEVVRDFYTLIGHGAWVTAIGASDTHHLDGVMDGVARTYVLLDRPGLPLDEAAFIAAIKHRRTVATTGPMLDVTVDGAGSGQTITRGPGTAKVEIVLRQASFVQVDALRVTVGGARVQTVPVAKGAREQRWTFDVDVTPPTWIGVDAGGDTPLPVWMTGTYQQEKKRPGVTPFAIIDPIRIEAAP